MRTSLVSVLLLTSALTLTSAFSRHRRSTAIQFSEARRPICLDWAGLEGDCVPARSCPAILKIIRGRPTSQDIQNIRSSICGFQRSRPLICCARPVPVTPESPVTEPVTRPPVTKPPVTKPPITKDPVSKPPVTDSPVTKKPVTEQLVTKPPVAKDPITKEPITKDPITKDPITKEPVTKAPVTDSPVTKDPVTDSPVTRDPVTEAPVTKAPVTNAPVTDSPVTDSSVTDAPVTEPVTESDRVEAGGNDTSPCSNCTDVHPHRHLLPQGRDDCGIVSVGDRIVGGTIVPIGGHPWLAAIGYRVEGKEEIEYRCGGSLINNRYVLTAAHCVTNLPSDFTVSTIRLGEYDFDAEVDCEDLGGGRELCADPPQDFDIEELVPHAQYDSPIRLRNDIALIRLSRPAVLSEFAFPVCLPFDQREELYVGERPWAVGFGLTSSRGESSPKLLDVRLPVLSHEECVPIFRRRANIGRTQLCAGGERLRDSCSGDSGGPLVGLSLPGRRLPFVQIGIVSFGSIRCGTKNVPGIYTRVTEYLDWIQDNMRE